MAGQGDSPRYCWVDVSSGARALVDANDESGQAVRQVVKLVDAGSPVRYIVSGPGYDPTEHTTLAGAQTAAEASIGLFD